MTDFPGRDQRLDTEPVGDSQNHGASPDNSHTAITTGPTFADRADDYLDAPSASQAVSELGGSSVPVVASPSIPNDQQSGGIARSATGEQGSRESEDVGPVATDSRVEEMSHAGGSEPPSGLSGVPDGSAEVSKETLNQHLNPGTSLHGDPEGSAPIVDQAAGHQSEPHDTHTDSEQPQSMTKSSSAGSSGRPPLPAAETAEAFQDQQNANHTYEDDDPIEMPSNEKRPDTTYNFTATSRPSASGSGSGSRGNESLAEQAAKGLPRVTGKPNIIESDSCRTCGKLFLPLFRRAHNCMHCGYRYCESDCDRKALMPKRRPAASSQSSSSQSGTQSSAVGLGGGWEMVEVCNNCFPLLQVTSGHPTYLRSLPLKRLQHYTKAYGLNTAGAIEKEDFVQTILKARLPSSGSLPPEAETYYRRRSVPKEGVLPAEQPKQSASTSGTRQNPLNAAANAFNNVTNMFANATSPPNSAPPPRPQASARPAPGYYQPRSQVQPPQSSYQARPSTTRPAQAASSTARPAQPAPRRAAPAPTPKASPKPRPPSPPVPSINSLVALPASYISTLSIGTLKAILYENHVKVDFSQILEKGELVRRVTELVKDERKRLERQAAAEEAEAAAAAGQARSTEALPGESGDADPTRFSLEHKPVPTGPQATPERDGLCVVCQDAEAQLAVVDCGHLCMCSDCSNLVMATSRECPLCRTRIVTEQRLIRIFRT